MGEFHSPDLDVTIRWVTALMNADEEDDATQPTAYAIQLTDGIRWRQHHRWLVLSLARLSL